MNYKSDAGRGWQQVPRNLRGLGRSVATLFQRPRCSRGTPPKEDLLQTGKRAGRLQRSGWSHTPSEGAANPAPPPPSRNARCRSGDGRLSVRQFSYTGELGRARGPEAQPDRAANPYPASLLDLQFCLLSTACTGTWTGCDRGCLCLRQPGCRWRCLIPVLGQVNWGLCLMRRHWGAMFPGNLDAPGKGVHPNLVSCTACKIQL